jgi:hypothetical protein
VELGTSTLTSITVVATSSAAPLAKRPSPHPDLGSQLAVNQFDCIPNRAHLA